MAPNKETQDSNFINENAQNAGILKLEQAYIIQIDNKKGMLAWDGMN